MAIYPESGSPAPAPRRGHKVRNLGIGCGVLLLLCVGLGVLSAVISGGSGGSNTAAVSKADPTSPITQVNPATSVPGAQAKATETKVPPTPTPAPGVGDTITSGNWEYKITQVKREKGPLVWSQYGNKTEPKGEWVIIDIDLKNIGKENFGLNTHDFGLVDDAGVKYDHSSASGASSSFQEYQKLSKLGDQYPPGVPLQSALVFDINPAARGLKLDLKQAKTLVDLGR